MSYIDALPKFQVQTVKKLDGSKLYHPKVPNYFAKTKPIFLGVRYYPATVECVILHSYFHEDGSVLDDSLNNEITFQVPEAKCPYLFILCMKASDEVLIPLAENLFLSDKPEASAYFLEMVLRSKNGQAVAASPMSVLRVLGYLANGLILDSATYYDTFDIAKSYCMQNYVYMRANSLWNESTIAEIITAKQTEKMAVEATIATLQAQSPIDFTALQLANDSLAKLNEAIAFYIAFKTGVGE